MIEIEARGRRESPQLCERTNRIHPGRHAQNDNLSIEPFQHPRPQDFEPGSRSRIDHALFRRHNQDLPTNNGSSIAICLNDGTVAADEVPNRLPTNFPEHPQIGPGILRDGRRQRDLWQHGKANIGQGDLRPSGRDQYHQHYAHQSSHGSQSS
jgi:hypothetical protein